MFCSGGVNISWDSYLDLAIIERAGHLDNDYGNYIFALVDLAALLVVVDVISPDILSHAPG